MSEFEKVNVFFQATDIETDTMMKELSIYHYSLKGRVYRSTGARLSVEKSTLVQSLSLRLRNRFARTTKMFRERRKLAKFTTDAT